MYLLCLAFAHQAQPLPDGDSVNRTRREQFIRASRSDFCVFLDILWHQLRGCCGGAGFVRSRCSDGRDGEYWRTLVILQHHILTLRWDRRTLLSVQSVPTVYYSKASSPSHLPPAPIRLRGSCTVSSILKRHSHPFHQQHIFLLPFTIFRRNFLVGAPRTR